MFSYGWPIQLLINNYNKENNNIKDINICIQMGIWTYLKEVKIFK